MVPNLTALVLAGVALSAVAAVANPCASQGAAESGVCKEVQAEAQTNSVGVQLLQVGKQRVSDIQADSLEVNRAGPLHLLQDAAAAPAAAKQIPSLSDIISAGRDIIDDATSVISNATSSITDSVGQVSTAAALAAATALNETLVTLGARAVKIQAKWEQAKDTVLGELNQTVNDSVAKITVFEEQLTSALGAFQPFWGEVSVAVDAAAEGAASALETVGQEDVASTLKKNVRIVLGKGASFAASLGAISEKVAGIHELATEEAGKVLTELKARLDEGTQQVDAVAEQLDETFGELTEQVAAKLVANLPGVNASAVDAAFASVRQTAAQVVEDLVRGPRDFVGELSAATAATREEIAPAAKGGAGGQRRMATGLFGALLLAAAAAAAA